MPFVCDVMTSMFIIGLANPSTDDITTAAIHTSCMCISPDIKIINDVDVFSMTVVTSKWKTAL